MLMCLDTLASVHRVVCMTVQTRHTSDTTDSLPGRATDVVHNREFLPKLGQHRSKQ